MSESDRPAGRRTELASAAELPGSVILLCTQQGHNYEERQSWDSRVSGEPLQLFGVAVPCCHHAAWCDHWHLRPDQAQAEPSRSGAFRVAGERMQELIAAAGTTEEELMEDFKRLRRERRMQKS